MVGECLEAEVLGYRIHYVKVGKGPKIVFGFPGLMGSYRAAYKNLIELFAEHGEEFTFYSWDHPGYLGWKSQAPSRKMEEVSFETEIELCAAFLKTLGHAKYHVIGWSSGAELALRLAKAFPPMVDKVVVWGAFPLSDAGYLRAQQWFQNFPTTNAELLQEMKSGSEEEYDRRWNLLLDSILQAPAYAPKEIEQIALIADFEAISASVLVVRGGCDEGVTGKYTGFLKNNVKSFEVEVIPNAPRWIQDTFSGELFRLTKSFLSDKMAPKPLNIPAASLHDLPPEMLCKLAKYLGATDLRAMRGVNRFWNRNAKTEIRKRSNMVFIFENFEQLAEFNDTFAQYSPTQDIAAAAFRFMLPVLESKLAKEHLRAFAENFGCLATNLVLDTHRRGHPHWSESEHRETVRDHVTLLLDTVKGHVEDLYLTDCRGLCPSVIGPEPFARLRTLRLRRSQCGASSDASALLEESAILHLTQNVPAVSNFEFCGFSGFHNGDPFFLAKVLQNLAKVNSEVEVKLDDELELATDDAVALFDKLRTVAVRIVEIRFDFHSGGKVETLQKMLDWIGAHSGWLKVLEFVDADAAEVPPLAALRLPSLPFLEEFEYFQATAEALLPLDAGKHFPMLRKVTAAVFSKFFTVPLPQVTELTLTELTVGERERGSQRQFRLPPNLKYLTCPVRFIHLGVISEVKTLRRLKVTTDEVNASADSLWRRVTHGAPKLTLADILALPEPTVRQIQENPAPSFAELPDLKKLVIVLDEDTVFATAKLDAILFLSKMKMLQRLKIWIEFEEAQKDYSAVVRIAGVYADFLKKYHDLVYVIEPGQLVNDEDLNYLIT